MTHNDLSNEAFVLNLIEFNKKCVSSKCVRTPISHELECEEVGTPHPHTHTHHRIVSPVGCKYWLRFATYQEAPLH